MSKNSSYSWGYELHEPLQDATFDDPEKAVGPRDVGTVRRVTIYRDDSTSQVVYDNVKHCFWTAGNTVLVIAQYTEDHSSHFYIQWLRERICWFKDEPTKVTP